LQALGQRPSNRYEKKKESGDDAVHILLQMVMGSEWYFVMRKSQGCWRVLVNGADQTYRGSLRCLEEACDAASKAKRTNYGKSVSHTKLAVVA
jgi:hypothetical protein